MIDTHKTLLPECREIFIRLEEKIDNLITRADKINGRYEKHIDTSSNYRKQIDENTLIIKNLLNIKNWLRGVVLTIIIGVLSTAIGWGSLLSSVNNNQEKIMQLEDIHPRINLPQYEKK